MSKESKRPRHQVLQVAIPAKMSLAKDGPCTCTIVLDRPVVGVPYEVEFEEVTPSGSDKVFKGLKEPKSVPVGATILTFKIEMDTGAKKLGAGYRVRATSAKAKADYREDSDLSGPMQVVA